MADKPFFVYFATGATHAPHHVPKEYADRYAGRFDDGWDALRERTYARQKELGIVPPDAELTARPAEIPAWDDMPEELKPVLRRQMEVFAGFLEHTDHHVGRVIDAVADLGILDDTLVDYIIGDNGASAEGTVNGTFNESFTFNAMNALETPEFLIEHVDELGTPAGNNHYAVGWAHAMDTPYQWTKQVASHWGGTRNGTIVHWPGGIKAKARSAANSVTSSTWPRPSSTRPNMPGADVRARGPADAAPRSDHAADLRRRGGTGAPPDAVLRDVRQPWHLPPRLDRRDAAQPRQ